jgi:hypothetical protein
MEFAEFVEGKSVALVGPAVAPYNQSDEVEAHDLVYRISYRHDLDPPVAGYGKRTDIVFYNNEASRKYMYGVYDSFIDEVEWVVLKTGKRPPGPGRDISKDNTVVARVPFAKANQLPTALFHLMKCNPAKVTVFGADLYLGGPKTAYDPNHLKRTAARDWWGINFHEPADQHHFMKDLWRRNREVIVGDDRFLEALGMSTPRYYRRLREVWRVGA